MSTIAEINQLISDNLADFSNITPDKHRAVSAALLAYISTMPKLKVLTLESIPLVDRIYYLDPEIEAHENISGVYCMLECKVANNGFAVGDTVTAPTPYPADNGRTFSQGIGLKYTNQLKSEIKILVNDDVWVMQNGAGATADPVGIGPTISNWKLKVFVTYI